MNEDKVQLTIDGQIIDAPKGAMLIDVTDKANIPVPRFCYHKKLSIAANCRMCLVDVEKSPKPMPACATPVMEGMIVRTRSVKALDAQKATMEFLLINHPLDCPICDQAGECELQDVSYKYGQDVSQYTEAKRVVVDKDIGPLISTELTRCIQCTRCVRFGEEIAGMRELGATGRGDTMGIGTYIQKSVDSELSGNIIDICPVGALTAKPSRFKYRAWELRSFDSISAHDCVGSNISVHTNGSEIVRVVAKENDAINENWISDRDRFSYQGVDATDRQTQPMVNRNGDWKEVSWQEALEEAANEMELVIEKHGGEQLGGLINANATLEELYLFQKLLRAKGSNNIDHRLFQVDFSGQDNAPVMPWLGMEISDLSSVNATLMVASNLRKEQPLLNHRLRQAAMNGALISSLNVKQYDSNFDLDEQLIAAPDMIASELALICKAASSINGVSLDKKVVALVKGIDPSDAHQKIAQSLIDAQTACVLLGSQAVLFSNYSTTYALSVSLAKATGSKLAIVAEDSNTTGAWLAGCIPHRVEAGVASNSNGLDAKQMIETGLKGYCLFNIDPDFDSSNAQALMQSLEDAESVISIAPYMNDATKKVATVFLPIGTYFETPGTRVNCTGQWQGFNAAVAAKGESRPGWKVLRVLANVAQAEEFDYQTSTEVKAELQAKCGDIVLDNMIAASVNNSDSNNGIIRFSDRSIYSVDQIVRRAESLQKTNDAQVNNNVRLSSISAKNLNLSDKQKINLKQGNSSVVAVVEVDDSISENCLWVPLSSATASKLRGNNQEISVETI